jgi:hypothetical protein
VRWSRRGHARGTVTGGAPGPVGARRQWVGSRWSGGQGWVEHLSLSLTWVAGEAEEARLQRKSRGQRGGEDTGRGGRKSGGTEDAKGKLLVVVEVERERRTTGSASVVGEGMCVYRSVGAAASLWMRSRVVVGCGCISRRIHAYIPGPGPVRQSRSFRR